MNQIILEKFGEPIKKTTATVGFPDKRGEKALYDDMGIYEVICKKCKLMHKSPFEKKCDK